MGLQKYRADFQGEPYKNGGIPFYVNWIGGPSLALIRNCKIVNIDITARTAYIRGEGDAACSYKKKIIYGYVTYIQDEGMVFRAYKE